MCVYSHTHAQSFILALAIQLELLKGIKMYFLAFFIDL